MRQKGKTWIDHKNHEVPTYAINPVLRTEEKHTQRILDAALLAEKYLNQVVELTRTAYGEVYDAKILDAKIKNRKEPGDGMTLTSFDGGITVKITKPDNVYFDTTYTNLVKEKFEEYFKSFDESEAVMFLRDLVNALLYSPGGKVDMGKVLQLRKYRERVQNSKKLSTNSQIFLGAMDLFDKAVRTKPGSMGIYVDARDEKGKLRRVALKYTDI
jgi:hypothetical protein